ncbi:MAG: hypothetical protein QME96_09045 [Myxococcota bacterium]|nr:hypothetical protein [Myxococcota bacterium]
MARKRLLQLRATRALQKAEKQVEEGRGLLRGADAELKARQEALDGVAARLAVVREESSRAGTAAERLARLVTELRDVQPAGTDRCLLCGHEHGSEEQLWRSIARSVGVTSEAADAQRELLRSLEEQFQKSTNEVEARRLDFARWSRGLESASSAVREAEADAREVGAARQVEPVADADVIAAMGSEASTRADADASAKGAATLSLSLGQARSAAADAAAKLAFLREQHAAASADLQAGGGLPDDSPAELAEAEERSAKARESSRQAREAFDARETALTKAEQALQSATRELARAEGELRGLRDQVDAVEDEFQIASEELSEHGVSGAGAELVPAAIEAAMAVDSAVQKVRTRLGAIGTLRAELGSVNVRDPGRLREDLSVAERSASEIRANLKRLERAAERLREIQAAVSDRARAAGRVAVERCDAEVNSVLQTISRHAHLTKVDLSDDGGLTLGDATLGERHVPPRPYCSTGQVSALALAVFLGMALHHRVSRLPLLMMDEPVQHLDDVRFLNLCDVIRFVARDHQVLVSSADRNAAELWRRKLMSWDKHHKRGLRIYRFVDFEPHKGPKVESVEPALERGTVTAAG